MEGEALMVDHDGQNRSYFDWFWWSRTVDIDAWEWESNRKCSLIMGTRHEFDEGYFVDEIAAPEQMIEQPTFNISQVTGFSQQLSGGL